MPSNHIAAQDRVAPASDHVLTGRVTLMNGFTVSPGRDEAFHELLHSRRLRDAFLTGQADALAVSKETLAELRTIDPALLVEVAERIAANALTRTYAGVGSVLDLYPVTVAAYRAAHPDARPAPGRIPV